MYMNEHKDDALIQEINSYLNRLFPICRSITGNGNRQTLRILQEIVPLSIHEVPSGAKVYDWTIPDEWNILDASIAGPDGHRVVDFQQCNLHVVSYSEPVRQYMAWKDLLPCLYVHPDLPGAIPYRTSYYRRNWGFCVTHAQFHELERLGGPFEVVIDSTLEPGFLTYGELLLPGRSDQEILLSTYICHPSLANDNLSGTVMTAFLARWLQQMGQTRYSYRIVWVPETIGAIAYCAQNQAAMQRIDMGLVITTVGGPGQFGYKQSWQADHSINKMIEAVLLETGQPYQTYPFDIHGSDERQYSSPGFRINAATICKDRYYEYPEYHSSLDNLSFVAGKSMAETLTLYKNLIDRIEARCVYRNTVEYGEVMLSRYNLYPQSGGAQCPSMGEPSELDLILWLLFCCNGRTSLTEIADRLNVAPDRLENIVARLEQEGILTLV